MGISGNHAWRYINFNTQCYTIVLYVDQQLVVKMVKFVYLEVMVVQDEWKCATMVYGAQCVMIPGTLEMLGSFASNLDSQLEVSNTQRNVVNDVIVV